VNLHQKLLDANSQGVPARVRRVLANKICEKLHGSSTFGQKYQPNRGKRLSGSQDRKGV